jgi:serine/threonine protein kinase
MSIALSEFWSRLVRVGITDSSGCKELASSYSRAHGGTPPSDAKDLAKFLVKSSVLSKFQARSILAGKLEDLRTGDWIIIQNHAPDPFGHWLWVRHLQDDRTGVLLRASNEALGGGRDRWLEAHQEVISPTLQAFECEQDLDGTTVFSPLAPGRLLANVIRERGSLSPEEVIDLGLAIAQAISAMHARPLIHGAVRLDRVWVHEQGSVTLLRDPSGPPVGPWEGPGSGWLSTDDSPLCYAAPEFLDHSQPCDVGTDLYSLGCLLFRILTGRPFVEAAFAEEAIARHASETAPELADAIAKGESGDPLFRVLAYAMAKSPAARFSSAEQLAVALAATRQLIPSPPLVTAPPERPSPVTSEKAVSAAKPDRQSPRSKPSKEGKKEPSGRARTVAASSKSTERAVTTKHARSATAPPATAPPAPSATAPPATAPQAAERRRSKDLPTTGRAESSSSVVEKSSNQSASVTEPTETSPTPPFQAAAPPAEMAANVPIGPPKSDKPAQVSQQTFLSPIAPPPLQDNAAIREPDVKLDSIAEGEPESTQPADGKPTRRRRKKKDRKAPIVLGGLCVAVLVLLIGMVTWNPDDVAEEPRRRPRITDTIPSVTGGAKGNGGNEQVEPTVDESVSGYQLVSDDQLLYVPPYAADAEIPPLQLLPPGPAVIVTWKVNAVLTSDQGREILDALSPEFEQLIETAVESSKVTLDDMSRCTAALHPGSGGWPEVSLSIELTEPRPRAEMIELWQVAASRTAGGATIYAGDSVDGAAFYLPDTGDTTITSFAVGSIQRISEVADAEGAAIPLPRSMERLWNAASAEADFVALITPNFLFADGREMLKSALPELFDPLKSLLIPDVAGALFTADLDRGQCYIEARVIPSGGMSEAALLRRLQGAVESWPQWAEEFIVTSIPDPSWRLLATRLPAMMRFVSEQFRYGISDGVVISNTYLPSGAVPQVSLAVVLAMNTSQQPVSVAQVEPERKLTVEEMLDRQMSVSFDQESLEFALDAIVGAFKADLPSGSTMPPLRIIGSDLELSGITQNQQVRDFSKADLPLRQVLTDLVVGANPDKSATGPNDPKQSLIWVVTKDPAGQDEILITTRSAAAGKYPLPKEFQASDSN